MRVWAVRNLITSVEDSGADTGGKGMVMVDLELRGQKLMLPDMAKMRQIRDRTASLHVFTAQ